jgi:NitT/TauT family transport system ATP-binding protein
VLALDKRRHDPHAPHRFGATAVYDLALRKEEETAEPEAAQAPVEESA